MSNPTHYKMCCPHCGGRVRIRNSVGQHQLLRSVYLQCQNLDCSASYRAALEITHEISPSGRPNPSITLPKADAALRREAMRKEGEKQMDLIDLFDEGQQPQECAQ